MHVNVSTLYLVATPIGNLQDITLRALEVLGAVDIILCEDTRVTQKLLSAHNIEAKLFPYHDKNGEAMRPKIIDLLQASKSLALVSDAGAPLISDPGYKLTLAVREAGFKVEALPGASSVITALQLSGFPTDNFLFSGFMPRKNGERDAVLKQYRNLKTTLVFFEAPSRLLDTLSWLNEAAPDAEVAVTRELTKRFEEVTRGSPKAVGEDYESRKEGVLGEIVLCIRLANEEISDEALDDALLSAMKEMRLKEAAQYVAEQFNLPKNKVYTRALTLKKEN
jgi:16S rRNA (cytidine1402-2'-O)-methyltransferase